MNIEEIRKNAPEGATHYEQLCDYIEWIKNKGSKWFYLNGFENKWVEFDFATDSRKENIKPI